MDVYSMPDGPCRIVHSMDSAGYVMNGIEIGRRVKEEREKRRPKWSARLLAHKAGISHSYVSHLEQGMYERPGVAMLQKIADALDIGFFDLIGIDPSEAQLREEQPPYTPDPIIEDMNVNALAIGAIDRDALEHIAFQLRAMREKVERDAAEEKRAERRRQKDAGQAGPPDS